MSVCICVYICATNQSDFVIFIILFAICVLLPSSSLSFFGVFFFFCYSFLGISFLHMCHWLFAEQKVIFFQSDYILSVKHHHWIVFRVHTRFCLSLRIRRVFTHTHHIIIIIIIAEDTSAQMDASLLLTVENLLQQKNKKNLLQTSTATIRTPSLSLSARSSPISNTRHKFNVSTVSLASYSSQTNNNYTNIMDSLDMESLEDMLRKVCCFYAIFFIYSFQILLGREENSQVLFAFWNVCVCYIVHQKPFRKDVIYIAVNWVHSNVKCNFKCF